MLNLDFSLPKINSVVRTSAQGMKLAFFAFCQPAGDFEKGFRPAGYLSARIKYVYTKLHKSTLVSLMSFQTSLTLLLIKIS
jgi:hypothetical protein